MGTRVQDCQAEREVLVLDEVYDEFVREIEANTGAWKVGDPLKPETRIGPLVDESIASKVDQHISDATKRGARIRTGGSRATGFPTDLYYQSTVLEDVSTSILIAKEETFGPVCPLIRCETVEDAVEIANSGEYGLAAGVFTKDFRKAMHLSERIRTGEVIVNYPSTFFDLNVPFGDLRRSGIGRVYGKYGIMSFSQLKSVIWNLVQLKQAPRVVRSEEISS